MSGVWHAFWPFLTLSRAPRPAPQRPYTLTMLERALRDIHFNCDPKKSAKQQALEALPLLQASKHGV